MAGRKGIWSHWNPADGHIDKQAKSKVFVGAGPGTFEQLRQQLESTARDKTVG